MIRLLHHALVSLTWSERPVWISPELRRTWFRKGEHVRRVWLHKDLRRGQIGRTYLGLGSIGTHYIRDRVEEFGMGEFAYRAEACRELLEQCLELSPIAGFERSDLDGTVLRLDLAITEMKPGSVFLRWFEPLTFFGFGHAWVQIEGVLTRQSDDKVLLKFVHRRRNSGIQQELGSMGLEGGLPLSETLIGGLVRHMAYDILMELDRHLNRRE